MSDDEHGKVIKRTDLADEVSTERAIFRPQLEKTTIKAGKTGVELNAESSPGTPQSNSLTTLYLVGAVAAITGTAWAIGIPAIAALAVGLGATVGIYLLVYLTSGVRSQP